MSEAITEVLLAVGRGRASAQNRLFPGCMTNGTAALTGNCLDRQGKRFTHRAGKRTVSEVARGQTLDVGSRAHFMALAVRARQRE